MTLYPRDVVVTARSLLGTPYLHQGRTPGPQGGIDCIGVPIAVVNRLDLFEEFFEFTAYGRDGSGLLEQEISLRCPRRDDPTPGAILLFKATPRQTVAQHCAICTEWGQDLGMIHAYQNVGSVREHELIPFWLDRLMAVYEFPNIQY